MFIRREPYRGWRRSSQGEIQTPLCEECEAGHDPGCELMKSAVAVMLSRLQETRRQLIDMTGAIKSFT
jgi:hypothetical protein